MSFMFGMWIGCCLRVAKAWLCNGGLAVGWLDGGVRKWLSTVVVLKEKKKMKKKLKIYFTTLFKKLVFGDKKKRKEV